MKTIKLLLIAITTLFFMSGCYDYLEDEYLGEYYKDSAFNVVNMKVGSDTEMAMYFDDDNYPIIDYRYNYSESIDYDLHLLNNTFAEIYLQDCYNNGFSSGFLQRESQTMLIFGADVYDEELNIIPQVRIFENKPPQHNNAVNINIINALPTEEFSNFLPYLGFESTLFLEVNGYRVSNSIDYMQNDRFIIDGVDYSSDFVTVTLVLSDGSALMYDLHLRNGHSYNLVIGHYNNSLLSEPTIYMYDVSY